LLLLLNHIHIIEWLGKYFKLVEYVFISLLRVIIGQASWFLLSLVGSHAVY